MTTDTLAFTWTETNRHWLIETPIRIAVYLVVALLVRWVAHRMINRATRRPRGVRPESPKAVPALVRHLRDRTPAGLRDPTVVERRQQRAETIGSVLKSVVSVILLVWVVLSVFSVVGVNIAPFLASAGIIGLAIGFGAQNLVKDFVSGVFMLLEDQYGVGDVVDLGEATGEVETVGLRITTVRDIDGTLWYVRNGEIVRVGNMSQDHAVARIEIPVGHDADVARAQVVALSAAREAVRDAAVAADVLGAPQMLGVQDISATTVTLRMTVTTSPSAQWAVARRIREAVLLAFDEHQIARPATAALAAADV
ncbi:mechanosensitive ion channel family protein [uncultured Williamsia sp.]|uniref:mechanosensitive ion channel family protein n=1 Tax=uncultured Williamsia sp. TaxID=259311 RepID=UPI0026268038|nr:mechanosensitive ion channel family protein [uncultured Williamsia sp.]